MTTLCLHCFIVKVTRVVDLTTTQVSGFNISSIECICMDAVEHETVQMTDQIIHESPVGDDS